MNKSRMEGMMAPRVMEIAGCIACGQPVKDFLLTKCEDFYLRTPYVVDYGVCQECRLVQQVPIPSDTQSFYPQSYPMHHSRGRLFSLARKIMIRGVYFEPDRRGRDSVLMDFGCGDGSYLQSIRGKVDRIVGFEPSREQALRLREQLECEVYSSLIEAGDTLQKSVDVITAHFVLEHLTDLHSTFRFWNKVLKHDGIVHLAVPNLRSREARIFGKHWHGLDAPRHISFPDMDSLSILAESHGFQVVDSRYGIFPNTWAGSLATILAGRYQHSLFLAFMPLAFVLSCLFPCSTIVFTLAKNTHCLVEGPTYE